MCNFPRILHTLSAKNGLQVHYGRLDALTEGAAYETSAGAAAGDGDGRVWGG